MYASTRCLNMEEREWTERPDRAIAFHVCASSRESAWRGIDAVLYEATAGYSDVFFENHSISMHVGAPVFVTSHCDGERLHRLQVPGDIKIVPAGYSRVWEISSTTHKLTVDLAPWFVREAARALELNGDSIAIAPQLHLKDPRVEHICWGLLGELRSDAPFGRLYAESLGCALATALLAEYGPRTPSRPRGLAKRQLANVLDYIRENISRDLSLAELAGIVNLSPSHFKVLFKASAGLPVHRHVINARVERAVYLLTHTDDSLCDIAAKVGFANQSHLSRHLKRVHGTSPATIRHHAH